MHHQAFLQMSEKIVIGKEFPVSKTDCRFIEVEFLFESGSWSGCFPTYYPPANLEVTSEKAKRLLEACYEQVTPEKINETRNKVAESWPAKYGSETHKVFEALLSGDWECRSCGSGKINDQPAARIRDIKKYGFIVATKTRLCPSCNKNTYHDQLLLFHIESDSRPEFRKPISQDLKSRIIKILGNTDAFFGQKRQSHEFVIDHKFPSQRWIAPESENTNLNDLELSRKFQLLTNQTNMLKSRLCDQCVASGLRPSFLGITWFYNGDATWKASSPENPESGCVGCPYYDLKKWKLSLLEELSSTE